MDIENKTAASSGNLKISNNVIATVAKMATLEIEGVESITLGNTSVHRWFSKTNYARPIKISIENGSAMIDICIVVKNGFNIPQLSIKIQQNVKSAVENMTGLVVSRVDITVVGITTEAVAEE